MPGLSTQQMSMIDERGFLSLPGFASAEEAARMRSIFVELFAARAGEREGAYGDLSPEATVLNRPNSPQILLPVNYAPDLHRTECFRNALRIARQILGEDARFVMDLAIFKAPRSGKATPWHQDVAFRDPHFTYREVSIWIALQDVDLASGCLQFLPGSHRGAIREHRPLPHGESLALECQTGIDPAQAVPCPLPAGGCTIHFPATLHASTPNSADIPRIAYILTFGTAPEAVEDAVDFPWLSSRATGMRRQRLEWMRRGGFLVTAWRRLRRGDLRDCRTMLYWARRALRTLGQGQ
jgi:ectoine hydroxylase-related dioxygenase (phytanoyl-CoA dioxygenase family)